MLKFDNFPSIEKNPADKKGEKESAIKDVPELKREDLEKLKQALGEPTVESVKNEILSCLPSEEMIKKFKNLKLSQLIGEIIQDKELSDYFGGLNPQQRIELYKMNSNNEKNSEDPSDDFLRQLPQEIQDKIMNSSLSSEEKKQRIKMAYDFRKGKNLALANAESGGLYGIHVSMDNFSVNDFLSPQSKKGKNRVEGASVDYCASFGHIFGGNGVRLKNGACVYIIEKTTSDELTDKKEGWYKARDARKIVDKIELPKVKGEDPESQRQSNLIFSLLRIQMANVEYRGNS